MFPSGALVVVSTLTSLLWQWPQAKFDVMEVRAPDNIPHVRVVDARPSLAGFGREIDRRAIDLVKMDTRPPRRKADRKITWSCRRGRRLRRSATA